jgi:hypothetical protein
LRNECSEDEVFLADGEEVERPVEEFDRHEERTVCKVGTPLHRVLYRSLHLILVKERDVPARVACPARRRQALVVAVELLVEHRHYKLGLLCGVGLHALF